jgi:hypothetical protein
MKTSKAKTEDLILTIACPISFSGKIFIAGKVSSPVEEFLHATRCVTYLAATD